MLWTFVLTCVLLLCGCFRPTGRCATDSDCSSGYACDAALHSCFLVGSGPGSDGGSPADGGPGSADGGPTACTPNTLPPGSFYTQPGPGPYKQFGTAIAADDSVLAVGAPLGTAAGTVQLFSNEAGDLRPVGLYRPMQTVPIADEFGAAVALSGDTLFIGAPKSGVNSAGAVYVVLRSDNIWPSGSSALPQLYGNPNMGGRLGAAVAVSGDTALFGAPNGSGSVLVLQRTAATQWNGTPTPLLPPSNPADSFFGAAVAVHKDRAVVGAPGSKTVFLYVRENGQWVFASAVTPDPQSTDFTNTYFGAAVALMDDTLVIGAPPVNGGSQAAVYFCSITGIKDVTCIRSTPPASSPPVDTLRFGGSVALSAATNLVLVGASAYNPFAMTTPSNPGIGTVYGYTRSGEKWNYKAMWREGADGDMYGRNLAVSSRRFFIGRPNSDVGFVHAYSYTCP